ncbi:MAG: phosphate/phosphite/phosphonate ABC transporter substrate-binding protein [Gammaproteobacteria bacterium]|nr:phosphate/phosphite/phosphonate ABC transporter substrate-binding protein [Gammaproteobacteria bacterium]
MTGRAEAIRWRVLFGMLGVWLLLCDAGAAPGADAQQTLIIGLTPVFLDDRVAFLRKWESYLEGRLARPVRFVQRQTYREVTDLVVGGSIDAAWLCGFPYVRFSERLRLLAVPLYNGEPLYQSYVIVASSDESTRSIDALQGKVFAYSDPDSNSGFLAPRVTLHRAGYLPDRFFGRTFFTWSHKNVVIAVAEGLAHGGAVDGYVWETLKLQQPALVARTRVVQKSELFGFPPLVTRQDMNEQDFHRLRKAFAEMNSDANGQSLLEDLNLDGFVPGDASLFDSIRLNAALPLGH